MHRLVLPLLLLLAISCTTASTVKTADPNTTTSTEDFEVRVVRTMFTETLRSDSTADARVILTVTNHTSETYDVERILVQGAGGRYYVPLSAHKAGRTIAPGATEAFNFRTMAYATARVTAERMTLRTTIEAHAVDSDVLREENFTARVRPVTLNIQRAKAWDWNYDASVDSAMDYPPLALYNPADYRR